MDFLESGAPSINRRPGEPVALCWHGGGAAVMLQGHTLSYFFQEVNEGCAVDFLVFLVP